MTIRAATLFVEAILFTVLVPGTVAVWIPYVILSRSGQAMHAPWTFRQYVVIVLGAVGTAIYFRCLWDFTTVGRGISAPIDHPKRLVVRACIGSVSVLQSGRRSWLGSLFVIARIESPGCTPSVWRHGSVASCTPMSRWFAAATANTRYSWTERP